jgi:hypothetical protein
VRANDSGRVHDHNVEALRRHTQHLRAGGTKQKMAKNNKEETTQTRKSGTVFAAHRKQ